MKLLLAPDAALAVAWARKVPRDRRNARTSSGRGGFQASAACAADCVPVGLALVRPPEGQAEPRAFEGARGPRPAWPFERQPGVRPEWHEHVADRGHRVDGAGVEAGVALDLEACRHGADREAADQGQQQPDPGGRAQGAGPIDARVAGARRDRQRERYRRSDHQPRAPQAHPPTAAVPRVRKRTQEDIGPRPSVVVGGGDADGGHLGAGQVLCSRIHARPSRRSGTGVWPSGCRGSPGRAADTGRRGDPRSRTPPAAPAWSGRTRGPRTDSRSRHSAPPRRGAHRRAGSRRRGHR